MKENREKTEPVETYPVSGGLSLCKPDSLFRGVGYIDLGGGGRGLRGVLNNWETLADRGL